MTQVLGILLALACALTTNVGFLFKHRGACAAPAVDIRHPLRSARALFASKLFSIGMLIASAAWIFHVAAMAVAPLSLVQAVLAGGVVLLAVMAERTFGLTISRKQWVGIILTAIGLLLLGFSLPAAHGAHSHYSTPAMIGFEGVLLAAGTLLILGPRIVVTIAAAVAACYASAKGLQDGDAVPVIAITGAAANVAGIVGGILVFGDPLSTHPLMFGAEMFAFALVLF